MQEQGISRIEDAQFERKMKLIYIPDFGFKIDDHLENRTIKWNDQRIYIRQTILNEYSYREDDFIYDELDLSQKRDIYQTNEVFFILTYDVLSNGLKELEIHHGIDIEVNDVVIKFGEKMTTIAKELNIEPTVLDDGGTYLFPSLKMTLSNSRTMGDDADNDNVSDTTDGGDVAYTTDGGDVAYTTDGGDVAYTTDGGDVAYTTDGGDVAYFYASTNIDHLLEDNDY